MTKPFQVSKMMCEVQNKTLCDQETIQSPVKLFRKFDINLVNPNSNSPTAL